MTDHADPQRPTRDDYAAAESLGLLPCPTRVRLTGGAARLAAGFPIAFTDEAARPAAELLAARLAAAGGPTHPVAAGSTAAVVIDAGSVERNDDPGQIDESYRLDIDGDAGAAVRIVAACTEGALRGVQTLVQLLRHLHSAAGSDREVPRLRIEDRPRFGWRGLHLDVSRHFFDADEVCRLIDLVALHRMNVLHLHLTDDQGWRLPSGRYPRLTEVGGYRDATLIGHDHDRPRRYRDGRYGGAYTPDDLRRIVAHAAGRGVHVLPEIDLPGHTQAAIAAYPELGTGPGPRGVRRHWGISTSVLNLEESTVEFARRVVAEACAYFPCDWFHLGGDEVVTTEWSEDRRTQDRLRELGLADEAAAQSWFLRRVASTLAEQGKRMVGWDEILEGDPPPDAMVMSWRDAASGVRAARAGREVVMTPMQSTYFDQYQTDDPAGEPLAIGGHVPLERVYAFDPAAGVTDPRIAGRIRGAQGQLWTEYTPDWDTLTVRAFPRLCALAESLWSGPDPRGLGALRRRLTGHLTGLAPLGVARHGPV
ncbi:MAG: beta-N-acetylhexosaminidase [Planctomycetota bacterium]